MNLKNKVAPEKWNDSYASKPEIYDLFSKYEDFGNKAFKKLLTKVSFKNKIVLDIGCGSGKYISLIAPLCKRYYALDQSEKILTLAKKKNKRFENVYYINSNSENIPLKDNSINIVFSSWGFGMNEISKTMDEVKRVTILGGECWAFGNYPSGEFMELRGKSEIEKDRLTMNILNKKYNLKVIEVVKTNFGFPSENMARKVFQYLFGEKSINHFKKKNLKNLKHEIIIQYKKINGN